MSDDFNPDEFLTDLGIDESDSSPAIKQLRAKLKSLSKDLKARNDQIAQFEAAQAKQAVTTVWDELGVPQPIRDFYRGEAQADDIKAWWETSKGFFNIQQSDAQSQAEPEGRQELAAVQKAASLGHDQSNGTLNVDALRSSADELLKSRPSTNKNALADWLNANGFRTGAVDVAS